ncbi:hypothetical protein [Streptomyces hundungensis]|nr:hypothetical protein [Streptomyces hundungensis]
MTRGTPTSADQHLIDIMATHDVKLSVARLERWRTAGLIPRPGPGTLIRSSGKLIYRWETVALVSGLLTCASSARRLDDLVLLAFFNDVKVPAQRVKVSLAKTFFPRYFARREEEHQELENIPQDDRDAATPEYNWAEVAGALDMRDGAAVKQMRANLKRRPRYENETRSEVNGRIHGILTWLNHPELPLDDQPLMADLRAALAFDGPSEGSRAAWTLAAICHSQQRAVRRETCAEERLHHLLAVEEDDLRRMRELVLEWFDAMWFTASEGRLHHHGVNSAAEARAAGGILVEWVSQRQVHPPGSRPAQIFLDSLRGLWFLCGMGDSSGGEGRAAFAARTGSHGTHTKRWLGPPQTGEQW